MNRNQNTYVIVGKFKCQNKTMLVVKIDRKSVCIMPEKEYDKIVRNETKIIRVKSRKTY